MPYLHPSTPPLAAIGGKMALGERYCLHCAAPTLPAVIYDCPLCGEHACEDDLAPDNRCPVDGTPATLKYAAGCELCHVQYAAPAPGDGS